MHTVRAATLSGFKILVQQEMGVDVNGLLALSDLPASTLSEFKHDDYLPLQKLETLFSVSERVSNTRYIAARLARRQKMDVLLGILGVAMQQCETVEEALQELQQYFSFQVKGGYVNVLREGDDACVEFVLQNTELLDSTRHIVEFALVAGISILENLCGRDWRARYVQFIHSAEAPAAELERLIRGAVHFNQSRNAIVFARHDLERRIASANPHLNRILHQYLADYDSEQSGRLSLRVEKLIRQQLDQGRCSIENIAAQLGMHRRTLHRKLALEGETYFDIHQKVLRDLASQMVKGTQTRFAEIAEFLGYSSASAFSRAFKSWYAIEPRVYRVQAQQQASGSDSQTLDT